MRCAQTTKAFPLLLIASLLQACGGDSTGCSMEGGNPESEGPVWAYSGIDGPANWGKLEPGYATCSAGHSQSPVNITRTTFTPTYSVRADYQSAESCVTNTGRTIMAVPPKGSTVQISGAEFSLLQMHFHAPSEHTLNGQEYPAEVHFVHRDASGKLAVIGAFIDIGADDNASWQSFVESSKQLEGDSGSAAIEWPDLLPSTSKFFRYVGSLTTPPCTEGVAWIVLQDPILLSSQQLSTLMDAYWGNRRPTQQINGRAVYRNQD